ncbi:HAMP domain-containing histidine kinase [Roseomonas sp. SSH11]|uniref:histidine kinase n=1 Tax=Pararoseomonas baculiformis TaxID=2820812 RepID=A0ABS4AG05_9PROT|nr:HAMP domain-containing sensor histidine kinase [Pararoseomonas baculiformis]MBP0445957.1 HAMP domain-containing histidine kinase [Pararoseomonas baculiformis]
MRFYLLLGRLRIPFGYAGKFFIVAFLATHVPLISAVLLLFRDRPADWELMGALLLATLGGTIFALFAVHGLLAPVRQSMHALQAYANKEVLPELPLGLPDLGGRLMAATQSTLAQLDTALLAARGAQKEAVASALRRERALAEVTHELRTPLNAVLGFAELLQMQPHGPLGDQRYAEFANDIAEGGQHMLALIEDVQHFTALREGKQQLVRQPVRIGPIAQRAVRLLRAQAASRRMTVEQHVPAGLAVMADPRAMLQILLNLLGNAVKYAGPGQRAELRADEDGAMILIVVSDTGRGMSEGELILAQEPFGRVAGTGERGTGLGLPLVRALVELHGGSFSIESAPGQGTTVRLALHAAPQEPAPKSR